MNQPVPFSSTLIKLGGSLFDLPELKERLPRLLDQMSGPVFLVAGGGRFADEIRGMARIFEFSDALSHELAISAMRLNGTVLSILDSRLKSVRSHAEAIAASTAGAIPLLRLSLQMEDWPGIEALPASWEVTSDSLAAWAATQLNVGRLLLAKSCDLPDPLPTLTEAAQRGLIDAKFPLYAAPLPRIDWINLRSGRPAIVNWQRKAD
jgi:dihydroneopterin aldolase